MYSDVWVVVFILELIVTTSLDPISFKALFLASWSEVEDPTPYIYLLLFVGEFIYQDGNETLGLDSVDDESLGNKKTGFYLLSPKSKHSLNSQFKRETKLYIHPKALFVNGDKIKASSKFGNYIFEIQTDENLREDCILIYSGTKGVNHLTQFKKSDDGFGAIFQEVKVKLEKI